MVQKGEKDSEGETRGRPIQYNREAVIDVAVELFWRQGRSGTSLETIVKDTGVNKSSIYNSFGGKSGLHELAAERYQAQMDRQMIGPLRDGSAGIDDLMAFFDCLESTLNDPTLPDGCLLVNSLGGADVEPLAAPHLDGARAAFRLVLERAVALGEVDQKHASPLADVLLMQLVGITIVDKSSTLEVHALIESAKELLLGIARRE